MSADLILRTSCGGCGSTSDLYGSNCKHMTLCVSCGKKMAETRTKCFECGSPVTRLIREYNVRASTVNEKNYFIGRFVTGLPTFWRKKNAENKWSLHKDGLQGRQLSETLREKYKNRPWVLEDESGQSQYQGHLEGAQTATYYLLMMQGKEFTAIPAGSWFNFNKVAQYKQLTLEEAEEKIKNRKKTADGYERWMMKAANTGPAAFGEVDRFDKDNGGTGGRGRKKISGGDDDDDEANLSDKGDDDDDEGLGRRSRLNKRGGDDDDDEGGREVDVELDDDIEKGDDWEHEEIFTDDDEAVGNDADEREDEPDVAAPETKDDDDDDDDDDEDDVEDGLTKDGKEIKKLLRKKDGLNGTEAEKPPGRAGGSDAEEDDDDDDDEMDDDIGIPQALAPKHKDAVKEEPSDSTSSKAMPSGSAKGTPSSSKSTKGKRKLNNDDAKVSNNAPPKKVKSENASVKEEPGSASKSSVPLKGTASVKKESTSSAVTSAGSVPVKPVTEEEIRAVLTSGTPVTTQDLVARFRARLKTPADKAAFAEILKRISKIHKSGGNGFVVLR